MTRSVSIVVESDVVTDAVEPSAVHPVHRGVEAVRVLGIARGDLVRPEERVRMNAEHRGSGVRRGRSRRRSAFMVQPRGLEANVAACGRHSRDGRAAGAVLQEQRSGRGHAPDRVDRSVLDHDRLRRESSCALHPLRALADPAGAGSSSRLLPDLPVGHDRLHVVVAPPGARGRRDPRGADEAEDGDAILDRASRRC